METYWGPFQDTNEYSGEAAAASVVQEMMHQKSQINVKKQKTKLVSIQTVLLF